MAVGSMVAAVVPTPFRDCFENEARAVATFTVDSAALPTFPEFRRITPGDAVWYGAAAATLAPYADVTFANSMLWLGGRTPLEGAKWRDTPVVRYRNPFAEGDINLLPLAVEVPDACFEDLLEVASGSEGGLGCLRDVPAPCLSRQTRLCVADDPDGAEYLLDVREQALMLGPAFARTRAKLSRFGRRFSGDAECVTGLEVRHAREELGFAIESWPLTKGDVPSLEGRVMARLVACDVDLGHRVMLLRLAGELAAVAVYQVPQPSFMAVSHLKVRPDVDDLFDYCIHALACEAEKLGIPFLNVEQDLGIPGIREHKRRLRPNAQLRKYTVTRRGIRT